MIATGQVRYWHGGRARIWVGCWLNLCRIALVLVVNCSQLMSDAQHLKQPGKPGGRIQRHGHTDVPTHRCRCPAAAAAAVRSSTC